MTNLPSTLHGKLNVRMYDSLYGLARLLAKYPLISSLIDSVTGASGTFTRSTVKTFIADDGSVDSAAIDTAAFTGSGVLLEPASTNSITYSNDLTNASWTKTNLTPTHNDVTGPDGALSAGTLTCTSNVDGGNELVKGTSVAITIGQTRYIKMIVAKGTVNHIVINCWNNALTNAVGYWFNLDAGTVGAYNGGGGGWSATASISALSSGYYECKMVVTAGSDGMMVYAYPTQAYSSYAQSIGDSIKFYNLSVQENDTSSILNGTAAALTRTVDVLTVPTTGWANNNFAYYFEYTPKVVPSSFSEYLLFEESDANNYINVFNPDVNTFRLDVGIGGVFRTLTCAKTLVAGTEYKILVTMSTSTITLTVNDVTDTDTGIGAVTHAASIQLGGTTGSSINGVIDGFKHINSSNVTLAQAAAL